MNIIRPKHINDTYLDSSNVAETDFAAYNAGTTYAIGDQVIVVSPSSVVTMAVGAPGVITWANHGLVVGDIVVPTTTGALLTGLTAGVHYYVRTVRSANTFTVSGTKLGVAIVFSGTQSGTHTLTVSSHKIYESLQAGNVGNTPRLSPTYWLDVGNTNRWKMFDESLTSRTENQGSIEVSVTVSGRADSIAMLNLSATSVRFRQRDGLHSDVVTISIASPAVVTEAVHGRQNGDMLVLTTTGALPTGLVAMDTYFVVNATTDTYQLATTSGGTAINTSGTQSGVHSAAVVLYDQTYSLVSDSGIQDWYDYFFEPVIQIQDFVELEMPQLSTPTFDITLSSGPESMAACGACIIGQRFEMGTTQLGAKTGIQDYSLKQRDDFGNYSVLERAFAKRADFTVVVENARVAFVQDTLSGYRATPIVYVGSSQTQFANTILYAFYRDFSIDIAYSEVSICNLSLEGLT